MWLHVLLAIASVLLSAAEPELPIGAQRALGSYNTAETSARAALVKSLEAEQAKATKANKLDEALAIRALIEKAQAGEPLPAPAKDDLLGDGAGKSVFVGKYEGKIKLELLADGSATTPWQRVPGKWTVEGGKAVVRWTTGQIDYMSPPDKDGVFEVVNGEGQRYQQRKEAKK
jgi:hypothetical protein